MATDPNSFEALKPRLSARTLKDIEGLDPGQFGFGREECCGPIPAKMADSMAMHEHAFYLTTMDANDWDKRTENVPGFSALHANMIKSAKYCDLTVASLPEGEDDGYTLRFRVLDGRLQATQYHCAETGAIPWLTKGTIAIDRTEDVFIFVCAHRSRDARCGYCGHVLVDLIAQAVKAKMAPEAASRVHVMACAHVGGHIYAGNVIVYNRHGGVGFGLFRPVDVDDLVDSIAGDKGTLPDSLKERIRGQMMGMEQAKKSGCDIM